MTTTPEILPDANPSDVINAALSYFGWPLPSPAKQVTLIPLPVLLEMALEEVEHSWLVRVGENVCTVVERIECRRFKSIRVYDVWERCD